MSILPNMQIPVAEYYMMTSHLKCSYRGAFMDLFIKQWSEDMKPIDLDNRELIIRLTRIDGRQYEGAMKAIRPFFRKIEGRGYIFEWGNQLWHESLDKHISYSDRGKKGATVKLERAREKLEEYQRLQSLDKDNTKSLPNKNSDSEVIPENKESDSAKLTHNSKANKNKPNKSILEAKGEGNKAFQSPSNGIENPNADIGRNFKENMFIQFWEKLQANNSRDNQTRYEDWKGQLYPESREKIGQHWHDSKHNLQTTTELFKDCIS